MDIREILFNYRSYTPIPMLIAVLVLAEPILATVIIGFSIALAGELLRIWAVQHAGGATRTTDGAGASVLITHGPFAYVRNPLYLGCLIAASGPVVATLSPLLACTLALCVVSIGVRALQDEQRLRAQLGPTYDAYCRNVKRLIPFIW